jgi:hypothetical protein
VGVRTGQYFGACVCNAQSWTNALEQVVPRPAATHGVVVSPQAHIAHIAREGLHVAYSGGPAASPGRRVSREPTSLVPPQLPPPDYGLPPPPAPDGPLPPIPQRSRSRVPPAMAPSNRPPLPPPSPAPDVPLPPVLDPPRPSRQSQHQKVSRQCHSTRQGTPNLVTKPASLQRGRARSLSKELIPTDRPFSCSLSTSPNST